MKPTLCGIVTKQHNLDCEQRTNAAWSAALSAPVPARARSRTRRGRIASAWPRLGRIAPVALFTAVLVLWAACGGPPAPAPGFSPDAAIVLLECPVADAEVWVDDRFIGHVDTLRGGISVAPGSHRIEVRATGYHTFYYELSIGKRERQIIDVTLVAILP